MNAKGRVLAPLSRSASASAFSWSTKSVFRNVNDLRIVIRTVKVFPPIWGEIC
jgi:hypothetical protein